MTIIQAIQNPVGVNVFGSALIRVPADVATINLSIAKVQPKPAAAFDATRRTANKVRKYLSDANVDDVKASRITLTDNFDFTSGRRERKGFVAKIAFNIVVDDLECIEAIICGAVDAGANQLSDVSFQSRRLKELRAKARAQAVGAAKEKAQIYADAAAVTLGKILHIEDVNPDHLRGNEGHSSSEINLDEDAPVSAFDPGAISIGAAVMLTFAIE